MTSLFAVFRQMTMGVTMEHTNDDVSQADSGLGHWEASVRLRDGKGLLATVTDISAQGCKLRSHSMLPVGEIVELAVNDLGTFRANVLWSTLDKARLQFL